MVLSIKTQWAAAALVLMIALTSALTSVRTHAQSSEIVYGTAVSGSVASGSTQEWAFVAATGDILNIEWTRTAGDLRAAIVLLTADRQSVVSTQTTADQNRATLFDIRVAQPGPYLIRITGLDQTSGTYGLLVKNTGQRVPTTTPAAFGLAGTLDYTKPGRGALRGTTYEQIWRFKATAGDVIDLQMAVVSGDLDSYFTLVSPNNDFIGANDSADGGRDAGLFSITLPQTGIYTITTRRGGGTKSVTAGEYELTLTLRTPNRGAANTVLPLGGTLRGRLNKAGPVAEYRLEEGGVIAFRFDLQALHRLARARILDGAGAVVAAREGITPLMFSVAIPDKGPYFLQLSSDIYDTEPHADFGLSSYKLTALATPLRFGEAQTRTAAAEEHWFFVARAGDLLNLGIKPNRGALNRTANIRGPGDVVLFQGNLSPRFEQALTLPVDGLYQITVDADREPGALSYQEYTINAELFGVRGVPFARYPAGGRAGLTFDLPVSGTLNPSESWTLDAAAGSVINLTVQTTTNSQPLGVLVRAPDETLLGADAGAETVRLPRVRLPQDGRYTVIVFDPAGGNAPYTLKIEDAGGGQLSPETTVKGVMLPSNAYADWVFDAAAGGLINARLLTRTPGAWAPALIAISPTGEVIGRAAPRLGENTATLLGIETKSTGRYRVIVVGTLGAAFASYELTANIQPAFRSENTARIEQGEREPLPRFSPAPITPTQAPQVAALLAPPIAFARLFAPEVQSLPANTLIRGELTAGTLQQTWRIVTNVSTTISIQATALSGMVSPQLTLINRDGKVVAEELRQPGSHTALTYRVTQSGDYALVVRLGTESARYTLYFQSTNLRVAPLTILQGTPILYGQTLPGELIDANQINTYYFYGAANDVITLRATPITGKFAARVDVASIGGRILGNGSGADSKTDAIADGVRLPENGVYAVTVRSTTNDAERGRYALYLGAISASRLKNRIGGVLEPGQTQAGALIVADNQDTWLLRGRAGERLTIAVAAQDARFEPTPLSIRLQDTAGNTFAIRDSFLPQDVARLENVTLPAAGIYRVVVTGGGTTQGGYRITRELEQLRALPGVIGFSQTVGGVFNATRNADTWTFVGNAGDVIAVSLNIERGDDTRAGFQVLAENGLTLATAIDAGDGTSARADTVTLPFTSTYTILAANTQGDFKGNSVYALSLALQESKARTIGGALRVGQPMLGELHPDDPVDQWLISGRGGDVINLTVQPRDPGLRTVLIMKNRFGQIVAQAAADRLGLTAIQALKLPSDGVYTVEITGAEATIGGYQIVFDNLPTPITPTPVIAYGGSVAGLIADDRVIDAHLFTGRAGDIIRARASREPGSALALVLELRTQAGVLLARADALDTDNAVIENFRLPGNGTYQLLATRINGAQGKTSGRLNVAIDARPSAFPVRGALTSGQRGIGRLGDATPAEQWTYAGKAGDVVSVISKATSGDLDTTLTLIAPTGETIATNDDPRSVASTDAVINGVRLPLDGVYTVVLARVGTRSKGSAGNYELRADRVYQFVVPTPNSTPITPPAVLNYSERVVGAVSAEAPEVRYTFIGDASDVVNLTMLHTTDDAPPVLTIQDPAGAELAKGALKLGQTVLDDYQLPIRASYIISVKRAINAKAAYTPFTLTLNLAASAALPPTTSGLLQAPDSVIGTIEGATLSNQWLFPGDTGQWLSVTILPLSGGIRPIVTILNPAGQTLATQAIAPGAATLAINELTLPSTGIYTILVQGGDRQTGTYRLNVRSGIQAADERTLAEDGVRTGTLNAVRTRDTWDINVTTGGTVNVRLLTSDGDLRADLGLIDPRGQVIATASEVTNAIGAVTSLSTTVRDAGRYQVIAQRVGATTGSYHILYSSKPISAELSAAQRIAYGQTVAAVLTPTQPGYFSFTGKQGEAVNLVALAGQTGLAPMITLQNSAGETLASAPEANAESGLQGFVLPADGAYVAALSASRAAAYTVTLQRRQDYRPAQLNGRALVAGANQQNGILPNELFNFWTVNALKGQTLTLNLKPINNQIRLDVSVYAPDGAIAGSVTAGVAGAELTLGPLALPQDGFYQVVVGRWLGPQGKSTGRYGITVTLVK